jgi:hypothetical protein
MQENNSRLPYLCQVNNREGFQKYLADADRGGRRMIRYRSCQSDGPNLGEFRDNDDN